MGFCLKPSESVRKLLAFEGQCGSFLYLCMSELVHKSRYY